MTDQLAVARLRKEDNNLKVSPIELLTLVMADLIEGKLESDGLIIVSVCRHKDAGWDLDGYRCGVTRPEELAFLELAKQAMIDKWKNS